MAKSVTVIPATINPLTKLPAFSLAKRRTCGYARVSTDKDEQFTSYEGGAVEIFAENTTVYLVNEFVI